MKEEIVKFEFEQKLIEFETVNGNVMVNATQMAKIFDKRVDNFTRIDTTQTFIESCLKNANQRFISVKTEDDLFISKQKSGTWMHRILALKFAAWLNPDFELWVYSTIDHILFDRYKRIEDSLKISAQREKKIEELKERLAADPEYLELQRLELEERQAKYSRTRENRNQLDLFKGTI